jgi:L-2,4-diaminobutyrate decarboxylase
MTRDSSFEWNQDGLERAVRLIQEQWSERPLPLMPAPLDLSSSLPEIGAGESVALEVMAGAFLGGAARFHSPGYFAHMEPPTPWITWAAAMWAASLNQNLLHAETAPAAIAIEERVVQWLAPFFGLRGGHMVPGSTLANLTALWAARELRDVQEIVTTSAAHLSIEKAARLLRLPLRVVEVARDGSVRREDLGDVSRAALVLTAGTTAIGAVEPLAFGRDARWFHVDAAWAGPLRLSRKYASRLDGIEAADSVTVSAHKWLFQPKESALVMFADPDAAHTALSFGADYLAKDNIGLQGSHGAMALPLLAMLLAWGRAGVAERIEWCMSLAEELEERVRSDDRLELRGESATGVVVWRVKGVSPRAIVSQLETVQVAAVTIDGEDWLRSVAINPMAEVDVVVSEVLRKAESLTRTETPWFATP